MLFLVLRISSTALVSRIFNKRELLKLAVKKKKKQSKKRMCKAVRDLGLQGSANGVRRLRTYA